MYAEFKDKENIYIGYSNIREKQSVLLITNNALYINDVRALKENDVLYLKYLQDLGGDFSYTDNSYYHLHKDEDDLKKLEDFINKIDIKMPSKGSYIPKYKENVDSYTFLKQLALKGIQKRCGSIPKEYEDRLNEELKVINDMGFVDYFLIVYDYVLYAKKNDILVGPGRGSAAGSLVSYAIGITDIDPVKYDLLFARFFNSAISLSFKPVVPITGTTPFSRSSFQKTQVMAFDAYISKPSSPV